MIATDSRTRREWWGMTKMAKSTVKSSTAEKAKTAVEGAAKVVADTAKAAASKLTGAKTASPKPKAEAAKAPAAKTSATKPASSKSAKK